MPLAGVAGDACPAVPQPAAVAEPVAYTLTTKVPALLPRPRVLVLQLPGGPVHVIITDRLPSFPGSLRRVFASRAPERLVAFLGFRTWPELVPRYPWAGLSARDPFEPLETVDLFSIGWVLDASCELSSQPVCRDVCGVWVPVPDVSTSALPAGSLDTAILLFGALFASRGSNSQLATPQRIANSSGPSQAPSLRRGGCPPTCSGITYASSTGTAPQAGGGSSSTPSNAALNYVRGGCS
ncbi:hypothetical protein [Longispora albida]|uniref:hypothetical protein n=1 Tax=Longispora albida TaxID=203523 RepID=UPI000367A588|nr:hypothetical protein [Longispora albida]